MKGVTFNEQRAEQKTGRGSLLLSLRSLSLTHAPVRSLFWAQTKAALLGKKSRALWRVQQPRNEMCGGDGARFYSASLALVLWRRVKSTTLGRTSFERESGSEKGSRAQQFQHQRESRNDAFRGGNCFLSSNHHNGNCRNNFLASPAADEVEEQRAHACLAQFGRVVLNDVLAAVAFVMEAVNKRLRFYGRSFVRAS
jgi:hypothetical protein